MAVTINGMERQLAVNLKKLRIGVWRKDEHGFGLSDIPLDLLLKILNKMNPVPFTRSMRTSKRVYRLVDEKREKIKIHGLREEFQLVFHIYDLVRPLPTVVISRNYGRKEQDIYGHLISQLSVHDDFDNKQVIKDLVLFYYPMINLVGDVTSGLYSRDIIVPFRKLLEGLYGQRLVCDVFKTNQHLLQSIDLLPRATEVFLPERHDVDVYEQFELEFMISMKGLSRVKHLRVYIVVSHLTALDFPYCQDILFPMCRRLDLQMRRRVDLDHESGYYPEKVWPALGKMLKNVVNNPEHINREFHAGLEKLALPIPLTLMFKDLSYDLYQFPRVKIDLTLFIVPMPHTTSVIVVILVGPDHERNWSQFHWKVISKWTDFCGFVRYFSGCNALNWYGPSADPIGVKLMSSNKSIFEKIFKTHFDHS